jgi:hypothetical protein
VQEAFIRMKDEMDRNLMVRPSRKLILEKEEVTHG